MDNTKKYWLIKTGLLSLVIPLLVMGFNYFMDPLWCFRISHRYNQRQMEIDERKQKTNYITYRDFNYRGLLIGSSRAAFISQYSFRGLPVYNYSVNAFRIDELSPFTNYAKKRNGRDFDYIFLGLDFENAGRYAADPATLAAAGANIEESNSLFYRVKTLLSIDTARHSWKNLENNRKAPWRYYDRNNVEHTRKHTEEELVSIYTMHLRQYTDKKMSRYRNFVYNEEYKGYLEQYKKENPRSSIVVFVTPTALPIMETVVAYGLLDDYLRWLSEIVDVYGELYLFMYPNAVTRDYFRHFFDPGHAYPWVGDRMVDAIYNKKISGDTEFGMLVTRSNFAEKRALLARLMSGVRDPRFGPMIRD